MAAASFVPSFEATTRALLFPFYVLEKALTKIVGDEIAVPFASAILRRSPAAAGLPMLNPAHMLIVVGAYLFFACFVRLPLNSVTGSSIYGRVVRAYALMHNAFLTALSLHMALAVGASALRHGYSLFGNKHVFKGQADMAAVVCLFHVSKILEFNDTLIMVLKRNHRQLSFLHIYHHATIYPVWWLVTYWAPTGESYFSAFLNSVVHVVMYSYYFFMAIGFRKISIVKKYITTFQMGQFVMMMIQATIDIFLSQVVNKSSPANLSRGKNSENYPVGLMILLFFYMISMLTLFRGFYVKDRKQEKATMDLEMTRCDSVIDFATDTSKNGTLCEKIKTE